MALQERIQKVLTSGHQPTPATRVVTVGLLNDILVELEHREDERTEGKREGGEGQVGGDHYGGGSVDVIELAKSEVSSGSVLIDAALFNAKKYGFRKKGISTEVALGNRRFRIALPLQEDIKKGIHYMKEALEHLKSIGGE